MLNVANDFRLRRGRFSEAHEQQTALVGWDQEYQQLGAGEFRGAVESARLGGVLIQRERFNLSVEQRSIAPEGTVNFAWHDSGWRVDGARLNPMVVGAWTGGQEHLSVNAGGADSLLVTVDAALLGARADKPFIAFIPASDPDIVATGAWLRSILALSFMAPGREADEFGTVLPRLVVDRLAAIVFRYIEPGGDERVFAPRVLNEVRAFVDERSGDPLSVGEICGELDLSRETLHRAFMEALGVSPSAWLRLHRLNGAHRDLRNSRHARESVAAIAMKWGFWHLGRFSAYYHSQFGRYPSADAAA